MFFNTTDFSFKITAAVSLHFDRHKKKSDYRPYHALSYRVSGNAEFIHENATFVAKAGSIAFVPAFYEYTLNTSDTDLIVIHFLSNDDLFDKIKIFITENPQYYERKFKELLEVWTKKNIAYEHECKSILYKIIMKMEQEIAETKFSHGQDKILEAVEYIHDNFNSSNLTIDYLSRMCGMSDTYLRRLFVKNFGMTPIQYINKLKLSYAKELLMSGYYTVSEVADKCGFNTVNYFSTFIKNETNHSPIYFIKKL